MRKKVCRLLSIVAGMFFIASIGVAAEQGGMRVVMPQNKTYIIGSFIHLVIAVNPEEIDKISYGMNKKVPVIVEPTKENLKKLPNGTMYLCRLVTIEPGGNTLTISGYGKGKKIEERNLQVYSVSKDSKNKNTPPAGYQRYVFHKEQNESICINCHKELGKADQSAASLKESPCYGCHSYLFSGQEKHGPIADGDCSTCHAAKDGEKYAVEKPVKNICSNCHCC